MSPGYLLLMNADFLTLNTTANILIKSSLNKCGLFGYKDVWLFNTVLQVFTKGCTPEGQILFWH